MKKSPVYPNNETSDYGGFEFDPQLDFSQFLEEARQHARQMNLQNSVVEPEEARKEKPGEAKKRKKSWKNSLFKWWKSDTKKRDEASQEPATSSHISKPKRGHVSGPIYGSGRAEETMHRRQTSGPIANLFNPTKRMENEMPYMCLDQLNNPHGVQAYGPVYLVT